MGIFKDSFKKSDLINHELDNTKKKGKGDADLMMGFSFDNIGGKKSKKGIYDTDLL